MLYNIILVVHVLIATGLIVLVLLQQGKGADAGAAFGSGASGTVFGSQGSASFLTRTTAVLATLFFVTSLTLFTLASNLSKPESVVDMHAGQVNETEQSVPPEADAVVPETGVPGIDVPVTEVPVTEAPASNDVPADDVPVSQ